MQKLIRGINKVVSGRKQRVLTLLLLSPVFWWILVQPTKLFSELHQSPSYLRDKATSIFEEERLKYVEDLRWESAKVYRQEFLARFFYNKFTVIVDEFFDLATFLSPRFYFQAGDGTNLSPPGVEPIPTILFPLWVSGMLFVIGDRRFKPVLIWLFFGFLAFVLGKKQLIFLFPVVVTSLYFAAVGVEKVFNPKKLNWFFSILLVYSIYLVGRAIWLS